MSRWEPDVLPGYWRQTIPLGPDPDGEGELVATLGPARAGAGGAPAAPCSPCTATPTTSSTPSLPITSLRGLRVLRPRPAQVRAVAAARPDAALHHQPGESDAGVGPRTVARRRRHRRCGVCMYGHSAGGLVVTLWLDRLRSRGGIAARNIGALVLNSPFFDLHGPAVLGSTHVGGVDRAGPAAQAARHPQADARRLRHQPAPRLLRRVRLQPGLEATRRFPRHVGWINAMRRGQTRLQGGSTSACRT